MNRQLLPTLRLSLEMTDVLARIEQSGIKIKSDTLEEIKQEYEQELEQTQRRLDEIIRSVMGDTPINLNSADDRTVLFYSRHVKSKTNWCRIFNMVKNYVVQLVKKSNVLECQTTFAKTVRDNTVIKERQEDTDALIVLVSRYSPNRKDGTQGKAVRICRQCNGAGVSYRK